ncbi:MAG: hypothetical protein ACI8P3_003538 [Saprospiraceae bacterium]|jgi:hypothetical protein
MLNNWLFFIKRAQKSDILISLYQFSLNLMLKRNACSFLFIKFKLHYETAKTHFGKISIRSL